MPVQPMKTIAAVALSDASFGVPEMMAAGILTSAFVFVLGVTRLMKLVYWFVPLPVVRGIQLAQGLNFAMAAVKYIRYEQDLAKSKSLGRRPWAGLDGLALAIAAIFFVALVNGAGDDHSTAVQEEEVAVCTNENLNMLSDILQPGERICRIPTDVLPDRHTTQEHNLFRRRLIHLPTPMATGHKI
ncbi:molybdate transporter 1-like [Triticum dicoccoides]|uniref:molybdate transporter 1-like n=1 Tax=Triticum dicoccoides TaxID=85692 RepID=UPI0018909C00|nr:molybdate transporter 1-like [Triticum dicoccoides]XP_044367594.1 molybdate transporter 1-like [Triticum aestivum]